MNRIVSANGLIVFILIFWFLYRDIGISDAGMLTYSFDDGHISVYTLAFSILDKYGQVGTVNVISDDVRKANSGEKFRVNSAQLIEMEQNGWEVCSHSKTHPHFSQIPQTYRDESIWDWQMVSDPNTYTYWSYYGYNELPFLIEDSKYLSRKSSIGEVYQSPGTYYFDIGQKVVYVHTSDNKDPCTHEIKSDSVQRELEMSKQELYDMGISVKNFIVPYSDWNEEREALAITYYDSVGAGYHQGWFNLIPPTDSYWLARRPIKSDTTVAEVEQWIDDAIENNQWLILMFHRIVCDNCYQYKYDWSDSKLEELVAWVKDQDINVVTQEEGLYFAVVPIPATLVMFFPCLLILWYCVVRRP